MGSQKEIETERHVDLDPEIVTLGNVDEPRLLRKLDWRLLPAVSLLYLLSFLDRSNGM